MKVVPHDIDAEEALISSLLIDGDAIRLVENTIKATDFYHELCSLLYQACTELRSRRETINQITVAQELNRQDKLELCGGAAYLSHLISTCPTSLDIEYYAQIVRRLSVSRQLINLSDQVASVGYNAEPDTNRALETVTNLVAELRKSVIIFDGLVNPKDAANKLLDMIDEYNNPKHTMGWGYTDLDDLTSGIYPELIIFGGRPGTGKTQLMLDVLENLAITGKKILFCSAEMSIKSILERKIARELSVDIRRLRGSGLGPELMGGLAELAGGISENQVYYLSQGIKSQDVYNEAIKLKEHNGLDIVFVDYLQILKDCWQLGRDSKAVLVGRASKILKALVNDLQIPVICASQLNRDLERRPEESRKPVLADLRECVTGDTLIECFDMPHSIESIYKEQLDIYVKSYKEFGGYEYVRPSRILNIGVKECLLIRTKSGTYIEISEDTPVRAMNGWVKAKDLCVGSSIALDTSASSMKVRCILMQNNSNLYFDEVVSIKRIGKRQTYDFSISKNHNFIANGILVHNSGDIEQDADVVFLLWRDLANIDESVRNILEIKMAKNRQLGDARAIKLNWLQERHRYVDAYRS